MRIYTTGNQYIKLSKPYPETQNTVGFLLYVELRFTIVHAKSAQPEGRKGIIVISKYVVKNGGKKKKQF